MKGDLTSTFMKGGTEMTRVLNEDREFTLPNGDATMTLKGARYCGSETWVI